MGSGMGHRRMPLVGDMVKDMAGRFPSLAEIKLHFHEIDFDLYGGGIELIELKAEYGEVGEMECLVCLHRWTCGQGVLE